MAAITSQWWRRLVNTYKVKADTVCLQCKNCVILSASEMRFSQCGTREIYLPLPQTILCVTRLLLQLAADTI